MASRAVDKGPTACGWAHLPFKCWPLGRDRPHRAPRHERASLAPAGQTRHMEALLTKIAADSRPLCSATLSPHRKQSPTVGGGSGTAGCAPPAPGRAAEESKVPPPRRSTNPARLPLSQPSVSFQPVYITPGRSCRRLVGIFLVRTAVANQRLSVHLTSPPEAAREPEAR